MLISRPASLLPADPDERHAYRTLLDGLRALEDLEPTYSQAA